METVINRHLRQIIRKAIYSMNLDHCNFCKKKFQLLINHVLICVLKQNSNAFADITDCKLSCSKVLNMFPLM